MPFKLLLRMGRSMSFLLNLMALLAVLQALRISVPSLGLQYLHSQISLPILQLLPMYSASTMNAGVPLSSIHCTTLLTQLGINGDLIIFSSLSLSIKVWDMATPWHKVKVQTAKLTFLYSATLMCFYCMLKH